MAHTGKIACHFPDYSPNPNHDVEDIKFLPAGTVIPAGATDAQIEALLVRVNKVYAIPAGATVSSVADLQQYVVWEWLSNLAAGNETIAFEYTPSADVSLTSIGIFTDSDNTNTTCNIAVYHESGLVVYRHNVDTVDAVSTKYGLSGRRRHIDGISGVTLKAGLKYYIQYTQQTDYISPNFYPAYYDGTPGNYKVWYYGDVQNKQTVNMATFNDYRGVINDSAAIFHMNEGDFFIWNGSSNIGMTPGYCYVRSNVGQTYIFTGIIGDPTSYSRPVTAADIQAVLDRPPNGEFIWYCHQQDGMSFGQIWAKTVNTASWVGFEQSGQYGVEAGEALHVLNTAPVAVVEAQKWGWFKMGDKISLKTGYTSQVTSDTPLPSVPEVGNRVVNGLYYALRNGWEKLPLVVTGTGPSDYTWLDSDSAFKQYVDVVEMYNWLDYVGNNSDLISYYVSDGSIVASLRDDTTYPVQNSKKYYLEINGNEV